MRLLFSLSYYTPYISGVSVYAQRLADLLSSDHSCEVLCMKHQPDLPDSQIEGKVRITRVKPSFLVSKGALSWHWPKAAYLATYRADVVFIHLPQFEGWMIALFARIMGKKVISIYHCDVHLPDGIFNLLVQRILDLANYCTLWLSSEIVAYTEDYAKHSRLLPFVKNKIVVILPPVVITPVNKKLETEIAHKIGKTTFVIGIASRLSAEKGIEYLLQAVPLLEKAKLDFKIVIAGPKTAIGEEHYQNYLSKLAATFGQRVVFFDTIAPEQMTAFYKNLDVLVLPSVNSTESFGLVQVEAMLSGLPVIASDLPGVRVPIQLTGAGLIVPPRNSDKIANAILKIYYNRDNYLPSKKIHTLFSLANTKKAYERLILS